MEYRTISDIKESFVITLRYSNLMATPTNLFLTVKRCFTSQPLSPIKLRHPNILNQTLPSFAILYIIKSRLSGGFKLQLG